MDIEKQNLKNSILEHNKNESAKFIICDKVLGAYIHCINEFTMNHSDCKQISHLMHHMKICNINTKLKLND